jgi:hypothetical protein
MNGDRMSFWDDVAEATVILNPRDKDLGTCLISDLVKFPNGRKDYFNGLN